MLIDWITARCPMAAIDHNDWERLRVLTERILRYCPRTGSVVWETSAWDSVRSDSHQIAFRVTGDAVLIQGSPARVCGSGDAVFGEGPAAALDLVGCLDRMREFVSERVEVELPRQPEHWSVSRVDVTGNFLLEDLAAVRIALRILRDCEGGRYRVSQQAGDSVYWSHRSDLRSGKTYGKGPHVRQQIVKPNYTGRRYTEAELDLIDRILRGELRLGARWWRRLEGREIEGPWTWRTEEARAKTYKRWYQVTADDLLSEWQDYFYRMLGNAEMNIETNLKERIRQAAKTEGQGKAAFGCWTLIQTQGWEAARELFSKSTWYRHLQVLHAAGLGDADLSAGKVVQLRRKILEAQLVHSWDELRNLQRAA